MTTQTKRSDLHAGSLRRWHVVPPILNSRSGVTVMGSTPAGALWPEEEGDFGKLPIDLSAIGIPTSPGMFALRVEGDSMSGANICDGDVVLIDKRAPKPGDIVIALIENAVTLKRYLVAGDRQFLHAENPKYEDIELPLHAEVQGVVVGSIRKH